jgi:ankyrin repeat protein
MLPVTGFLQCGLKCVCVFSLCFLSGCISIPVPRLQQDISSGDMVAMRKHLAAGADLSERDAQGRTPLHYAISTSRREMALELIRSGADVNARLADGRAPLNLAVEKGYVDVVDALLERKATLEVGDTGPSPLFEVIRAGNDPMMLHLVRAGVNVNRRDFAGQTPLYVAANLGHRIQVERLIELGADINATLPDGQTALHGALLNKQIAVADFLYARGIAIVPAQGEVGGWVTALVYRFTAEREYTKRLMIVSADHLERARSAFLEAYEGLDQRADQFDAEVWKVRGLNALALILGGAQAGIEAQTSLSGTGVAIVPQGSTATASSLRSKYASLAAWSRSEADRMAEIRACVLADASGDARCFADSIKETNASHN